MTRRNKRIRQNWDAVKDAFDNGDLGQAVYLLIDTLDYTDSRDYTLDPIAGGPDGTAILCELLQRLRRENEGSTLIAMTSLLRLGCDSKVQDESGQLDLCILAKNGTAIHHIDQFIETLVSFVDESERSSYVNATDANRKSAICYAAERCDSATKVVNILLDLGADPFVGDPTGSTVLFGLLRRLGSRCYLFEESSRHYHSEEDSHFTILRLLQLGCDPKAYDEGGETASHVLAKSNNGYNFKRFTETLISFIDESERTSFINATNLEGNSAIIYASRSSYSTERVITLLDLLADPFVGDPGGLSVLCGLLRDPYMDGILRAFTKLVKLGCDPMVLDESGQKRLTVVLGKMMEDSPYADHGQVLDPIFGGPVGLSILWRLLRGLNFANESTTLRAVTSLLRAGCNPKVQDENGQPALCILVNDWGDFDFSRFAETLISFVDESERSSCINATDSSGKSAIFYAVDYFDATTRVTKLLELSADPFVGHPSGLSILHRLLRRFYPSNEDNFLILVTKLMQVGCDPKVRDERGQTALHNLTQNDYAFDFRRLTEHLLSFINESQRASFVNATDQDGKPAIFYATEYSTERVIALLDLSADPFVGDPSGSTVLRGLLRNPYRNGVLQVFTTLLRLGCDPVNQDKSPVGSSILCGLLHVVDTWTTLRGVTSLLRAGCSPKVQDKSGQPALCILAKNDEDFDFNQYAETLISFVDESERRSYINDTDSYGKSAIFYAADCYDSTKRITKLLDLSADPFVGHPNGSSVLHTLLRRFRNCRGPELLLLVTRLLQMGCDPKARDERGQTALHNLTQNDAVPDFRRLTEHMLSYIDESQRASFINATDNDGKPAILYATECCDQTDSTERVIALLDFSADPFVGDPSGSTVLHRLIRDPTLDGVPEAFSTLLRLGCDPMIQDERGKAALHILASVRYGYDFGVFAEMLLSVVDEDDRTSRVNSTDAEGNTPLFYAVRTYDRPRVRTLLELGADPNVQCEDGYTILHFVIKKPNAMFRVPERWPIVSLLLLHGADPTIVDQDGNLPLIYLGTKGEFNPTVVFLLLRSLVGVGYQQTSY